MGKNIVDEKKSIDCGIIMPISATGEYTESHWNEVKSMIERSANTINEFDIRPSLVSDSNDTHIIHRTIIKNIYYNDIIVCDLSSKNPNVMFELGLRMAFGKSVVIIKDDKTQYSFDTGGIEHIEYNSDLSYTNVERFQKRLEEKITSTYRASMENDYIPFVKQFGDFELESLPTQKIPAEKYLEQINDRNLEILSEVKKLNLINNSNSSKERAGEQFIEDYMKQKNISQGSLIGHINLIVKASKSNPNVTSAFQNDDELEKFIANLIIKKL